MTITIHPANPDWPLPFQHLKTRLLPATAQIHHIGTTAVPGLAAKNIIDIQVSLPRLADLEHARLPAAGLTRRAPRPTIARPE